MRRSDQPQPALGKAIRQLREKRGTTQEDLAHAADITTGTLSLIERGHANPTWGTVMALSRALSTALKDLAVLCEAADSEDHKP